MAVLFVSSSQQFQTAINTVKSGDTIKLNPGTYANVDILSKTFLGKGITITSADPENPATLTGMRIFSSSGVNVSDVKMSTVGNNGITAAYTIQNSSNVHFDAVEVFGKEGAKSASVESAMLFRNSANVSVTNSEIHDVRYGIGHLDNVGVKFSNNFFHDIREDAIRGGGSSKIVVSGNMFTDFYPNKAADDHPDAIQFWTTATSPNAQDITISDNLIVRGQGGSAQGIFMRDVLANQPFHDVTISGNMVVGAGINGIAVDNVATGVIANNSVLGFKEFPSWIRTDRSPQVELVGNKATSYSVPNEGKWFNSNSFAVAPKDMGAVAVHNWLEANPGFNTAGEVATGTMATLGLSASVAAIAQSKIAGPELIKGTDNNDTLDTIKGVETRLEGGAGNDTLRSDGIMRHELAGGTGNDSYFVRSTQDVVIEKADEGTDTVTSWVNYTLGEHVENLRLMVGELTGTGNSQNNALHGSSGNDIFYGLSGNDQLFGGEGNDKLYGGDGMDVLQGGNGNDHMDGGTGNDNLQGGDGNDIILGGAGDDMIFGNLGSDTMTGGSGRDLFRYQSADIGGKSVDTITDFTRGTDTIDLRGIDARIATSADDAFAFIGSQNFQNKAGQLQAKAVSGGVMVAGDINGDGQADFSIFLAGVSSVSAADFVL